MGSIEPDHVVLLSVVVEVTDQLKVSSDKAGNAIKSDI